MNIAFSGSVINWGQYRVQPCVSSETCECHGVVGAVMSSSEQFWAVLSSSEQLALKGMWPSAHRMSFMTWQNQRSYQDVYRLLPVGTHGDFIVLPHWNIRPQAPWPNITLSWHWAIRSLPYPNNAERLARRWQVSIFKSLVWFDHGSNLWGSNHLISKMGDGRVK